MTIKILYQKQKILLYSSKSARVSSEVKSFGLQAKLLVVFCKGCSMKRRRKETQKAVSGGGGEGVAVG